MSPSRSRSRASRNTPGSHSVSYAQSVLPDGPVDEETVQLLNELIHPNHDQDQTLVDDDPEGDFQQSERQHLPWWRRPSPWLLVATPISATAMSATMAPKVEIYTLLVCSVHKPEIFKDRHLSSVHVPSFLQPHEQSSVGTTFPPSFDIATSNSTSLVASMNEPPKPNPCASDPVVAAAVARLATVLVTTMGTLGCLTTGWWGSISDRYGRTRILGFTLAGLLANDFTFIFVTRNYDRVPGGYWALVVGPIIEGLLGGFSSASAASHAYLADTTSSSERSRIFSRFLGLVFVGLGLGPTLGGLLVRYSHNLLSVFYVAAGIHAAYAVLVWIILPESLSKAQMETASIQYEERMRLLDEQERTVLFRVKRIFSFLKPLAIFIPTPVDRGANAGGRKWDWNMTLLAVAYGLTISLGGSLVFKLQYLISHYEWTSEYVGYLLTINGSTRAVYLAILLPLTIKFLKTGFRRPTAPESEPLLNSKTKPHSASFDLSLARVSLLIEVIAYTAMPFAPTGFTFTLLTMLSSFGAGFAPAVQSTSLELYSRKIGASGESGKLFGALSVVQALCAQILGPSIYGTIYMKTVATFPQAIFFVSVACVVISLTCLSLVRLPTDVQTDVEDVSYIPDHGSRDATVVDLDPSGGLRGRKKDSSPSIPQVTVSAPSPS
ncbi:MFS general substrate transporter [Mycena maculata]|uniref:MFS general substrate transporter n=1 Tax=Mycena maculata TaxID=230809 RepID=A0AAD7HP99_9AGAR|nr:MFS general substrate transporter [Mycena maculata]